MRHERAEKKFLIACNVVIIIQSFFHSSLDYQPGKMCPVRYIYHVLFFLVSNFLIASAAVEWKAYFDPNPVTVKTAARQRVRLILSGLPDDVISHFNGTENPYIQLKSEDESLALVKSSDKLTWFELNRQNKSYDAHFNVDGIFLGKQENLKKCSLKNT